MVYMQPEQIGWTPLLQSWIEYQLKESMKGPRGETIDQTIVKRVEDLFEVFFNDSASFLAKKCHSYVPVSTVQMLVQLIKIFEPLLSDPKFLDFLFNPKIKEEDILQRVDMFFLFALSWSVGSVIDEHS